MADEQRIELKVTETQGIPRQCWPITRGVPLPEGALHDLDSLWMTDPQGEPIATAEQLGQKTIIVKFHRKGFGLTLGTTAQALALSECFGLRQLCFSARTAVRLLLEALLILRGTISPR